MTHLSSCAVHNEPAYPAGPCTCGGWAWEEADKVILRWIKYGYPRPGTIADHHIAAALIKARADGERHGRAKGMREAAEIAADVERVNVDRLEPVRVAACQEVKNAIWTRADAIERGE